MPVPSHISSVGAVALTTGFTNGAGQIWLDNVQCRGTETRLIDCPANPLGNNDCSHIEDAGVRCGQAQVCTANSLRLQGGANNRTGRLEICNNNMWGTICDDLFGTPDATVACRQLGFSTTGMFICTMGNICKLPNHRFLEELDPLLLSAETAPDLCFHKSEHF